MEMSFDRDLYDFSDIHPIDIAETIASENNFDFDRLSEYQIAMTIEGQWRRYSVTLAWSSFDETLRMVLTYEVDIPEDKLPNLYEMLNLVNDQCWAGAFTYWHDQKLMVYRYGLVLAGEQIASPEQIDGMVNIAVLSSERYYPAFADCIWGGKSPKKALQNAIVHTGSMMH